MKLVIAVVQDKDSQRLSQALVKAGFRATKLASTGGFLREGNTTFLIGVDDDKVEAVKDAIRQNCKSREQLVSPPLHSQIDAYIPYPVEVQVGGATIFVLEVVEFDHF